MRGGTAVGIDPSTATEAQPDRICQPPRHEGTAKTER